MSKLFLKEFQCIERNDDDNDSPYFIIFVGKQSSPPVPSVVSIRKESWDDQIATGSRRTVEQLVHGNVSASDLVLVALLEQDDGVDVSGDELKNVRAWMKPVFNAFSASGSASPAQLASELKKDFARAIDENTTNDDVIAIQQLPLKDFSGDLNPLQMKGGDSGHYRVQFRLE